MKIKANKTLNNEVEDRTTFFYYMFRNILLVGLPSVLISALLLSLPHSSAEGDSNRVDSVTLSLSVSCTVSAEELTPHNAIFEGSGLHRENIGTTKVGVFCNDNNGYNIYAIGYGDNTDGNTDLVANSVGIDYNIETGVYSSGDAVSSWGMKLAAGTGTGAGGEAVTPPTINNGYNNYNVVPNVYTLVASRPSGTNMNQSADIDVTGSYFTTTYDIYASSAQPADTYTGKVKYILTHPNTNAPNTINDIDAAFAIAGKQKVYQDENGSYYAMQDMSTDICRSVVNTGESTSAQLVDIRDHNIYWVTKEKDNHCWMTQNLDLDINGVNTSPLNSNNTDISTDPTVSGVGIYSTSYGYNLSDGVWTWDPGTTTGNVVVDFTNNTVTGWNGGNTTPTSAEGGDVYYYAPDTTGAETRYDSLDTCADAHTKADCKHYHVGNYYNYTAAIASNNSGSLSTSYDNAGNSICPKNWRLPVAINSEQTTYEFGQLLFDSGITTGVSSTSYAGNGFKNIRKSPLWFVRGGTLSSNRLWNPASDGFYYSSTIISNNNAYLLGFGGSTLKPAGSYTRDRGVSVRCLAR